MANEKKGGLFARLTRLPERSEDYARKTLPKNRWALGWDLFKTNLGKIFKINLLMLLFLFPLFLLFIFNDLMLKAQATVLPFSQNLGIGYPIYPSLTGVSESVIFQNDLMSVIIAIILSFYFSIGLSGGFYVMRNMVWTEGVFVMSDFWSGVKKNYWNTLVCTLVYTILIGMSIISIDLANLQIAIGTDKYTLLVISKVISIAISIFFTFCYLFTLTLGVTYKLKIRHLFKNSAILGFALIPQNAFFAVFAMIGFLPLLFSNVSLILMLAIVLIICLSLAVFALIWTDYSQWTFDQFINDKVPGAKKDKGIYRSSSDVDETTENYSYEPSILTKKAIKPITDNDVEIAVLSEYYSREDLVKLEESKQRMIEDSDRYSEEHKDDYIQKKAAVDEFMADAEVEENDK